MKRPMSSVRIVVIKMGSGYLKGILELGNRQETVFGCDEEQLIERLKRRAILLRVPPKEIAWALEFRGSGTP
jgi:hypothetical protein